MKKSILILILFLFVIGFSNAFATTFYVKKTGLDSNLGTEAKPFLTIQKAINSLSVSGDQIWIYPGDYYESPKAVSLGKNYITMKGIGSGVKVFSNPDTPALYLKNATGWTIDNMYFSSTKVNATGYTQVVFILSSGYTTIQNCTITGGSLAKPIYNGLDFSDSAYSQIINNKINVISHYNISISYGGHVLVSGNDISNGVVSFLYWAQYCDFVTVENNYFHDKIYPGTSENSLIFWRANNGSIFRRNLIVEKKPDAFLHAILLQAAGTQPWPSNGLIENNTIIGGTTGSGIGIWGAKNFTIRNNIIVGTNISVESLTTGQPLINQVHIDYNDFYNPATKIYHQNPTGFFSIGTHNLTTNPLFAETVNYTLAFNSPVIDAGYPSGVDMGWKEYGASSTITTISTTSTTTTSTTSTIQPTTTITTTTSSTTTTICSPCKCCCQKVN